MNQVTRYEVAPFSALLNMIKYNYYDNTEIFRTLLAVLCDYDPNENDNREKTVHYIELLLDGNKDLVSCLVSFLPVISNPHVNEDLDKNILTANKRLKKTKQKTTNKSKDQDITVTENTPLGTEINVSIVNNNLSSNSTSSRILKSMDPSAIQEVVKREITPLKREVNQQSHGKNIVNTRRSASVSKSLPAPICTVVPSQNMPKMSPGNANMSIFPKPVNLPFQENITMEPSVLFPTLVNQPPPDKSMVETKNQIFFPKPKCWLNTSMNVNTNLYSGVTTASASDTAGQSEQNQLISIPGKQDNVYPPCEKQSVNYIPAVSWSNIPIYNFQTSYNTQEVASQSQAPIGQPLVTNSVQNSSNTSISHAVPKDIPTFSSDLLTETRLEENDRNVINIQSNSAPVYLGTNNNLASFPYTQQLVFQDGKTQNVFFKGSGINLPTNKVKVGNFNQNMLGNFSQSYHITSSIPYLSNSTRNYSSCLPPFSAPVFMGDTANSCGLKKASKPKKYTIAPNQVARKRLRLTPAQQVQNPLGGFHS